MEQRYENFKQCTDTAGIFLDFSQDFDAINYIIAVKKCLSMVLFHASHLSLGMTLKSKAVRVQ